MFTTEYNSNSPEAYSTPWVRDADTETLYSKMKGEPEEFFSAFSESYRITPFTPLKVKSFVKIVFIKLENKKSQDKSFKKIYSDFFGKIYAQIEKDPEAMAAFERCYAKKNAEREFKQSPGRYDLLLKVVRTCSPKVSLAAIDIHIQASVNRYDPILPRSLYEWKEALSEGIDSKD